MRQPLSRSEYMFYHALSQGYPATLNELIDRLKQKPYEQSLTVERAAVLASRLEAMGYVDREKVSTGQRGQPASRFTPTVPLPEVVEAEAERALQQLAFSDRKTLLLIRKVVNGALKAPTHHRHPGKESRQDRPKLRTRP